MRTRWLTAAVVGGLVMLWGVGMASPQPVYDGPEVLCPQLGQAAEKMAKARDAGVPLMSGLYMVEAIPEWTPATKIAMRATMRQVYANPRWTPEVARQEMERRCFLVHGSMRQ